MILIIN